MNKQVLWTLTVLIDERANGVYLSYDKIASYLAPCGNHAALVRILWLS
jgi:hypothetical protein